MLLDPVLSYLILVLIAALFIQAAYHKWRSISHFKSILTAYDVVPARLVASFAVLIPAAESAVAVLLFPKVTRGWAALSAATLLISYAAAIAVNLRRGRRDLDCGCVGAAERRPVSAPLVYRNLALAGISALAAAPQDPRPLGVLDLLTIVVAVAAVALIYIAADHLITQVRPPVTQQGSLR